VLALRDLQHAEQEQPASKCHAEQARAARVVLPELLRDEAPDLRLSKKKPSQACKRARGFKAVGVAIAKATYADHSPPAPYYQ
jgi:hypothetical protein